MWCMQPVLCYPSASSNNFPLPFIKQKMNIQTNKKKHKKKPTYRSSPTAHTPCFFFSNRSTISKSPQMFCQRCFAKAAAPATHSLCAPGKIKSAALHPPLLLQSTNKAPFFPRPSDIFRLSGSPPPWLHDLKDFSRLVALTAGRGMRTSRLRRVRMRRVEQGTRGASITFCSERFFYCVGFLPAFPDSRVFFGWDVPITHRLN